MTDTVAIDEEELLQESEGTAIEDPIDTRIFKCHPGDFYGDWPSDEQLSYFVRGGR